MAERKSPALIQAAPLLVDREHAAQALGISERTLDGLVRTGDLPPPRKISQNRTGWLWRELQAFAESRPVSDLAPGPGRRAGQAEARAA